MDIQNKKVGNSVNRKEIRTTSEDKRIERHRLVIMDCLQRTYCTTSNPEIKALMKKAEMEVRKI